MEAMKEEEVEEGGERAVGGLVEGLRLWQRCFVSWLRSGSRTHELTSLNKGGNLDKAKNPKGQGEKKLSFHLSE